MMPGSWSLEGKVAIVTGAARGIGRATADLLRERGARVVATDLSGEVHTLEDLDMATLTGDVGDEETARRTVTLAMARFGRLGILVSNAGRTLNAPLTATSVADWDAVMATNARGAFLLPAHVAAALGRRLVGEGVEDRRNWAETCRREAAIRELLNQYPATLEGWGGRRCCVGTWSKRGDSVGSSRAIG
jgi:NAD(P)-dependent dehydrogenase (short-subunit alcohol dehydrogenase family)